VAGFLAKYGAKLIENGYRIVPIKRGSKAPPFDKWSELRADKKTLKAWLDGTARVTRKGEPYVYNGAQDGIGILAAETPLVDLDIRNEDMSAQMVRYVLDNFGPAPVRIGLAPKTGILFRSDEPFSKILSGGWIDPFSTDLDDKGQPIIHKVEILGRGQQFVAYAIHPDTGQPYVWPSNDGPATTIAMDLPELTAEAGRQIADEFDRLAAVAGWTLKRSTSLVQVRRAAAGRVFDKDDVFAEDSSPIEIDEDELEAKLMLVPNADDHDTWRDIGMALYHQFNGDDRGRELWHQWSAQAWNYDHDELEKRWPSFSIEGKGRAPTTARLIVKLARKIELETVREEFEEVRNDLSLANDLTNLRTVCDRIKRSDFDDLIRIQLAGIVQDRYKAITNTKLPIGKAKEMTRFESREKKVAPKWLDGWVFCEFDETFYSMTLRLSLSVAAFNAKYSRNLLTPQEKLEGKSQPEQAPSQVALNLYEIPVVHDRRYMPGEDDLFWLNGTLYVNSYDGRNVPEVPEVTGKREDRDVQRVIAHFEHLFEHEADRRVLIDSVAYLIQNPGKRLNWATLIQGTEGDGKTFFYELFGAMLAAENVTTIGAQAVEEKYTSWAEGAQMVFVEEIRLQGHNRYDILNRLKPLITNRITPIRRMNVNVYNVINQTSYFLATNYKDALPLTVNDTRYFVLFSRWQNKDAIDAFNKANPDYYDRLFEAISRSPGAIRKWFLEHTVSTDFRPHKRAPKSVAKLEMIRLSKSDEQDGLEIVLAESARMDMTYKLLNATALVDELERRGFEAPYGRTMAKLLLENGFTKLGHVWIDDTKCLFWSREPTRFMNDDRVDALAVRSYARVVL
jgi:hypothetical protein